ncbi:MAG: sulfotransferase [Myxococcales bacterium]|nr:sulfotransferase [Myxococcales bacterium]
MFYFDFDNYFRMIRLAWNEKVPKARTYTLAVLCLGVPITASFHAVCFLLDRVFFPGLAKVEMKAPVFMVGHARSGTTLTHRLMSLDQGRFSYFLLYECYFPSLLQKKLIRLGIELDRRMGGFLAKRAKAWEQRRYGKFRHMHAMGLTVPEEDDIALFYSMASGFWITKMPYMGDLDFYHMNDWPASKRRRYNDFYREVVRRQLYLNGPDKIHLAKNPLWAGRVASLVEAFPDARFIVNVRDPRDTIPSLLKLLGSSWQQLGWEESRQRRCLQILADQSWHSYRHPLETLKDHPETKGAIVDYRDLSSDPAGTIERVYQDLGLPMSDAFREKLAAEGKRERTHRTRHSYSLEEFGLEPDAIREQLGDLFERFHWEIEIEADAEVDAGDEVAAGPSAPGEG